MFVRQHSIDVRLFYPPDINFFLFIYDCVTGIASERNFYHPQTDLLLKQTDFPTFLSNYDCVFIYQLFALEQLGTTFYHHYHHHHHYLASAVFSTDPFTL